MFSVAEECFQNVKLLIYLHLQFRIPRGVKLIIFLSAIRMRGT